MKQSASLPLLRPTPDLKIKPVSTVPALILTPAKYFSIPDRIVTDSLNSNSNWQEQKPLTE